MAKTFEKPEFQYSDNDLFNDFRTTLVNGINTAFSQLDVDLDNKADTSHSHEGYATENHNHDDVYAKEGHTHSGYATSEHTHTEYAEKDHSHTGYALANHTHDYMTASEVDSKIAAAIAAIPVYDGTIGTVES